jgi:hypothetical protein
VADDIHPREPIWKNQFSDHDINFSALCSLICIYIASDKTNSEFAEKKQKKIIFLLKRIPIWMIDIAWER